jgi:hypothetical protein
MALQVERKRENKEYLSATIAPGIIKKIDEVRGILTRSQYVQQALTERLEKDGATIRSPRYKNDNK